MEIKNIAKLSSYGAYIDEEFIYTNSLVEGKNVIVGNIAEYMYDLEQELAKKESDTAKEIFAEIGKLCDQLFNGKILTQEFMAKYAELMKSKGLEVE